MRRAAVRRWVRAKKRGGDRPRRAWWFVPGSGFSISMGSVVYVGTPTATPTVEVGSLDELVVFYENRSAIPGTATFESVEGDDPDREPTA